MVADSLIGIAYLAISVMLGYLGYIRMVRYSFSLDVPGVWIFYPQPQVSEFSPKDSQRLDEQRAVVAAAAKREIRHGST